MTTLGDDDVGKALRWLDELHVHRPHRRYVLLDHRVERAATLGYVAAESTNKANVIGSIDEDFDVHLFKQTRLSKNQNTFDNDNRFRRDWRGVGQARVRAKIVDGKLDRLACVQLLQMIDKELVINGIRMIEVCRVAIIQRHVLQIAIIKILLNEYDFVRAHRLENSIRDGSFP